MIIVSAVAMRSRIAILTLIANSAVMLAYLAWLLADSRVNLFFSRDGVIILFPVVPIVFAYICMAGYFGRRAR